MTIGLIGSIQDYSTKDGPGLRTTVFMKGCNLACKWCSNPELISFDETEVFFFPERIKDVEMAIRENEGALVHDETGWRFSRATQPPVAELLERNTQIIFDSVAQRMTVDECVDRLLRNRAFYDASDGGVTFSGGEAMIQVEFVRDCLLRLHEAGVHTAIDTAGMVPWAYFKQVIDYTDLFLYDIKAINEDIHLNGTKAGNRRILENARRLAQAGAAMWVRLVLVPGYNDDWDDFRQRIKFAAELGGAVGRVDILGYHTLGVGKYHRLGKGYGLDKTADLDQSLIDKALQLGRSLGLNIHYEPGIHA